jgi:type IV pilus assembly protein PilF
MKNLVLLYIAVFLSALFLQACVPVHNNTVNLNTTLALAYLQENQPEQAKYRLLLALEQAPYNPLTQDALAYYLEKTGELEEAEKHYLLAIRFSKHPGSAKNNYGTFLCRRGKYPEAISYFLAASQDFYYLNTANAYENAALCALKIPDNKQAQVYFIRAKAIRSLHRAVPLK